MTRTQLRPETILLDVDPGECVNPDCTYTGDIEAVLDPHDGTAEWECPCGNWGRRQMFEPY